MYVLFKAHADRLPEIERVSRIPDENFAVMKRIAVHLMESREECERDSLRHFENTPYELRVSTNRYGEKFYFLWWLAGADEYAAMERLLGAGCYLQRNAFPCICEVFNSLNVNVELILMEQGSDEGSRVKAVPSPNIQASSQVIETALRESEGLLQTKDAPNALQHVYTAFHSYLKEICEQQRIRVSSLADLGELFHQLRTHHSKLRVDDSQSGKMMVEIHMGFARVIEGLNVAQNRRSPARAAALLEPAEAMLFINAVRTMLHYLESRLK